MKRAIFGAAAMAVLISQANAAFVVGGNSRSLDAKTAPRIDATANFAVYNTVGGQAGDRFQTGISNFDDLMFGVGATIQGQFLYLYQVVNETGPDGSDLSDEQFYQATVTKVVSYFNVGAAAGLGFYDGAVVGDGNALGPDANWAQEPANPPRIFFGGPSVVALDAATAAITSIMVSGTGQLRVSFDDISPILPFVKTGLFGFTSDQPYFFGNIGLQDGAVTDATVLTTTELNGPVLPVPGTLVLFMSMLPFAGFGFLRRRDGAAIS